MFESLQENLSSAIRALRGRGRLTESNMRDGPAAGPAGPAGSRRQPRRSSRTSWPSRAEQAVGETVLKSLDPDPAAGRHRPQELVNLMGPVDHSLHLKPRLTVLMLCGLQGSGKTTTCGKLGRLIQPARPQADARGRRLAAPRGHPAVAGARPAARYSRLCRPGREGSRGPLPCRGEAGQGHGRRGGDPRHGRPLARRRRVDGPACA